MNTIKTISIFIWGLFNKKEIENYVNRIKTKTKIFMLVKDTNNPHEFYSVLLTEHGDVLLVTTFENFHEYYQSLKPFLYDMYGSFYELVHVDADGPLTDEVKKAKELYKKNSSSIVYMLKNLKEELKRKYLMWRLK